MFKVIWDNEIDTDALPGRFETEQAAINAGNDWLVEMRAASPENPDAYSYEVEECDDQPGPSDEDLASAEEAAWYDNLNRGYAIDRI